MHAGFVCMGQRPEYYSLPGFGPIGMSWGWMLFGAMLGASAMYIYMIRLGVMRRGLQPPVATQPAATQLLPPARVTAQPLATQPPVPARVVAQPLTRANAVDQAREDLLEYIAVGGRPALQDLSAAVGMSEQDMLMRAFGLQPDQEAPLAFQAAHQSAMQQRSHSHVGNSSPAAQSPFHFQ